MYAVLYAYTPEVFATKDRGTGNALTATGNRVFGVVAMRVFFVFLCFFRCGLHRVSVLTSCSTAHHSHVRQPGDVGTGLHFWGFVHRGRIDRDCAAVRAAGEGESIVTVTKVSGNVNRVVGSRGLCGADSVIISLYPYNTMLCTIPSAPTTPQPRCSSPVTVHVHPPWEINPPWASTSPVFRG